MLRVRALTEKQKDVLRQHAHDRGISERVRKRASAVLLSSDGMGPPAIARQVGLSEKSVRYWIRRFQPEQMESLYDGAPSGRQRTYTGAQVEIVLATARTSPQTLGLPFMAWTVTRLASYLHEHDDIGMSRARISQVLLAQGLRWHTQDYVGAVRGLRELKPNVEELDVYLEKTGLTALLTELAQTFREAGYASALSARSGLVWSGRMESLVTLIREAEVEAVEGAIWILKRNVGAHDAFVDLVGGWRDRLASGEYKLAFEQDEAFHESILELNRQRLQVQEGSSRDERNRYDEKLTAVKKALDTIALSYTDLLDEPETWAQAGYYHEREELVQFLHHLEIARAMKRGAQQEAEQLMRRHYEWLWHGDPSDPAFRLPERRELFDE